MHFYSLVFNSLYSQPQSGSPQPMQKQPFRRTYPSQTIVCPLPFPLVGTLTGCHANHTCHQCNALCLVIGFLTLHFMLNSFKDIPYNRSSRKRFLCHYPFNIVFGLYKMIAVSNPLNFSIHFGVYPSLFP